MLIFKSKQKKLEGDLKIKLCGKRLYPTESIKYLGVQIDTNLTWQHHINDLSIKLIRANALLFKIRDYVSPKILRSVYFAIFGFHLSYSCLVWAQNFSSIKRILILQKKAVRIINFQLRNSHTSPLFKQNFILKFQDKICLENMLFVRQIIYHHQFLIHGLAFPQTNITMKSQVLHRGSSRNFFIRQIDMGSIQ